MENPCECGIEPPGSISRGVSLLIVVLWLTALSSHYGMRAGSIPGMGGIFGHCMGSMPDTTSCVLSVTHIFVNLYCNFILIIYYIPNRLTHV